MNPDQRGFFDSLTERVLGAVFEVSNTLGAGFLEKVYERALLTELCLRGIRATAQASFPVTYKGHYVGEYFADILTCEPPAEHRKEDLDDFLKEEFGALRVSRILTEADAAGIVTDFAARQRADLIMMPTRGHGVFRRFLLGSITAKVLHDSPCPSGPVCTARRRNSQAYFPTQVYAAQLISVRRAFLCCAGLWNSPLLKVQVSRLSMWSRPLRKSQNRGSIKIRRYLFSQARERWTAIQQELGIEMDYCSQVVPWVPLLAGLLSVAMRIWW